MSGMKRCQHLRKLDRFWYFGALWRASVSEVNAFAEIFGLLYRLTGSLDIGSLITVIMEREFAQQIYRIGARGWPVVALTGLLLGLSIIVYVSAQLKKIQAGELLGNLLVVIVVRELGPVLTALLVLFAIRSCHDCGNWLNGDRSGD